MRPSRSFGTDLWRTLIEKLDEGVIVFNQRGVVIYANNEAAHLLGYKPRDVLDLDKGDFIALCDTSRLDGKRFATAFAENTLGEDDEQSFQVVATGRRLVLTPLALELEHGQVLVLLLREPLSWRSDMIAQALMADMQSPLAFIADSATTLSERVKSGNVHPYEISALTRIILESQEHALDLWNRLFYLYRTDPRQAIELDMKPIRLDEVCRTVSEAVTQHVGHQLSDLRMGFEHDLPPVRASAAHLEAALYILLEQSLDYLSEGDLLIVKGSNRKRYVQLDLAASETGSKLRRRLLDYLPLAIAEQIIQQQGGRVWIDGRAGKPAILSLALPIWDEEHAQ
jgi:PAS domain-containing protein